jgi:hypothetical protein
VICDADNLAPLGDSRNEFRDIAIPVAEFLPATRSVPQFLAIGSELHGKEGTNRLCLAFTILTSTVPNRPVELSDGVFAWK